MHITIVSYTFPPSKAIGGRRWAKFSQYLRALGYKVSVVCANDSIDNGFYEKEFPGIDVFLLPKRYPDWLTGITNSSLEKILYFVYTRLFSLLTKQNYFDKGYAWKNVMLDKLEKIHQNKPINTLVITGAPFSLLSYGAEFKKLHNKVRYVVDFRDPWTWGTYYGFKHLTVRQLKFQNESEFNSVKFADMICYPTESIGNHLAKKYPNFSGKLYYLPHAYEPQKFPELEAEGRREGFVYGGTLYNGVEKYLIKLEEILKRHPNSSFKWDVYSSTFYPLLEKEFANGKVTKHGFIKEDELFRKISTASAYLVFFPETDIDIISTKFFEIIYTNTPILYIGEEGDVGKFIRNNRLGVHILPKNMEKELPQYLDGKVPFQPGYFDIRQYTFDKVTDNFVKAIESLKS